MTDYENAIRVEWFEVTFSGLQNGRKTEVVIRVLAPNQHHARIKAAEEYRKIKYRL